MRQVISLLAAALLGGCAGELVVPSTLRSSAAWSSMVYAAKDGPILVTVEGADAAAYAVSAAQAMTGAVMGYDTRFTADPAQAFRPRLRTVLVLDPAAINDQAACQGRATTLPGDPGRLRVLAAFCSGGDVLAAASGAVGARGPRDPAVAGLMRALAREIFTERPRDLDHDDRWDF